MFRAEYREKWFQNPLAAESVSQLKKTYFEASILVLWPARCWGRHGCVNLEQRACQQHWDPRKLGTPGAVGGWGPLTWWVGTGNILQYEDYHVGVCSDFQAPNLSGGLSQKPTAVMTGSRELWKEWVRSIPCSSKEDGLRELLCFFFF